jgi:uroporphyrinogen-III synthase
MSEPLKDRAVAITEHRYEKQLAALFAKEGARVVSCPLLEERPMESRTEMRDFIGKMLAGEMDVIVFFTGVGAAFLADEAQAMSELAAFKRSLSRIMVVARGPKPQAALSKLGLSVDLAPESPTSEGLLRLLESHGLDGKRVGVQLYGTPNPEFCSGLESLGAKVLAVQVYDYGPASDRNRVRGFVESLISRQVDALTFTSAPQVRALFEVAGEMGRSDALVHELNENVIVASIGGVTSKALMKRGVTARVIPSSPKMASLVKALADYFRTAAT